jgi:hypothetical protein
VITLPLADVGLSGSSSFDPARLHAAVRAHGADSLILLPQMLRAWVGWLMRQTGQRAPASLKLVAVGGAAVGAPLIHAAQALGIPACEGYGLSEGASVQTLNLPGAEPPRQRRPAVLPHARLRVAASGEIEVAGSLFSGYLGDSDAGARVVAHRRPRPHRRRRLRLHVDGRKKNLLITAFGRNVSPEWVETALRQQPAVLQAVVMGDGEPALSAVLWPTHAGADAARRGRRRQRHAARLRTHRALDPRPRHLRRRHRPGHRQRPTAARSHPRAARRRPVTHRDFPMNFHARLLQDTADARPDLLSAPIIQGVLQRGEVSLPELPRLPGRGLPPRASTRCRCWAPRAMRCRHTTPGCAGPLAEYIDEEAGHDAWILQDIAAAAVMPTRCATAGPGTPPR